MMNRAEKIDFILATLRGESPSVKFDTSKYTDAEKYRMIQVVRRDKQGQPRSAEDSSFMIAMIDCQRTRHTGYHDTNNEQIDWDKEWYNGKVYYDEVEKVSKIWREGDDQGEENRTT